MKTIACFYTVVVCDLGKQLQESKRLKGGYITLMDNPEQYYTGRNTSESPNGSIIGLTVFLSRELAWEYATERAKTSPSHLTVYVLKAEGIAELPEKIKIIKKEFKENGEMGEL